MHATVPGLLKIEDLSHSQARQREALNSVDAISPYAESAVVGSDDASANKMIPVSRAIQYMIFLILVVVGAIEDWFARGDYAQDAISYLNVLHAIQDGSWKTALNPMWSIGYPLVLAAFRPLFPAGAYGEWAAVHFVNVVVFVLTFYAFMFMLREAMQISPLVKGTQLGQSRRFLYYVGILIFSCTELCMDNVSRVGPDLLVSCLLFMAVGMMLLTLRKPGHSIFAFLLGTSLGLAYLQKLICLPIAASVLAIVAIQAIRGLVPKRRFVQATATLLLFVASYVGAMSWANGHFTLGETGRLNYAIHVEKITVWSHWRGGPAQFGYPIHPARKLLDDPGLYEFGEPFHTTYPPFNNMPYWYEGHRLFFSPRLQALAITREIFHLAQVLALQPLFYAFVIALIVLSRKRMRTGDWKTGIKRYWPFFLPAVTGVLLYSLVHLEARYVASFLAILAISLVLIVLHGATSVSSRKLSAVLVFLAVAAAINFLVVNRNAVVNVIHGTSYRQNEQWRIAEYLRQHGLKPGDKVAVVNTYNFSGFCTWAEVDGLRIVAEIANDPFDYVHWQKSLALFWGSPPATQQKVYQTFRQVGAVAVIAYYKPDQYSAPGWQKIDGTEFWFYPLD
jgi:hypothetical protein